MKKIIVLFGSFLLFASSKVKAQSPNQLPLKKETSKPSNGSAPKTVSGSKGVNPNFTKGSNPKPADGSGSGSGSGSSGQSVAPHPTPPPVQSVAPRHKG